MHNLFNGRLLLKTFQLPVSNKTFKTLKTRQFIFGLSKNFLSMNDLSRYTDLPKRRLKLALAIAITLLLSCVLTAKAQTGPTIAAPAPPARTASEVISLFSGAYTDVREQIGFQTGGRQPLYLIQPLQVM